MKRPLIKICLPESPVLFFNDINEFEDQTWRHRTWKIKQHSPGLFGIIRRRPFVLFCVQNTDGILEARNRYGEIFGNYSLQTIIRRNATASSTAILQAVFTALDLFRQGVKSEDDMTLVIIKVLQDS